MAFSRCVRRLRLRLTLQYGIGKIEGLRPLARYLSDMRRRRQAELGLDLHRAHRFFGAQLTAQIEGIVTVLVGLSAFWWVPGYVEDAKFLTERERTIVIGRLQNDTDGGDHEPFSWGGVAAAFKDPLVWGYGFLFHAFAFTLCASVMRRRITDAH